MALSLETVSSLGVALGCGLLIGIDRERHKGSGPTRAFAGMRTFGIAALSGALAELASGGLVIVGAALVVVLSAMSYWRGRSGDPGITTELALFVSYVLGVSAIAQPAMAAGVAVVVAAILSLRTSLHRFARVTLTADELRDGLLLAGSALVVMPLLPDAGHPWLLGVNPKRLLGLAVAIMAIQSAAHIAVRVAGARLGMALSGFASGFASSVAATAAMGAHCRAQPALLGACVSGALLSSVATFVMMLIVTLAVALGQFGTMLPMVAAGAVGALLVSAVSMPGRGVAGSQMPVSGHAFSWRQALGFAIILSVASVVMAYVNAYLGPGATHAGAALTGLLDSHAAAASVLSLAAAGAIGPGDTQLAILLALSTNALSKVLAAFSGGRAFAWRIGLGQIVILLAAWAPYWLRWNG